MLDFLRKRKRSWIITFLLGLIIIVFIAFYGGTSYRDMGAPNIAQVNGEVISQREFAFHYQRELERYREILKGSLTPEMLKSLNIKATLLEQLIQKRLLLQEARALGLSVTDEELANFIAQIPDFQVAGRFNVERYRQLLRANRLTPAQFEDEQREQLTIQRLYSVVLDSVHVTDAEVLDRYRFEQQKVNLYYIRVPISLVAAEVRVADDEIEKYYERNKDSFKEPLKVQIEYLAYPFDRFAVSWQPGEKEIEEYYQANRDGKFRKPKEVKVRYISIRHAPASATAQKEDARKRANRVVTAARGGKDFAQLAKQESDDPTAAKGGEGGWLSQGPAFSPVEKVVFSLLKGAISDPIETPEGFLIVKAEDIREEKTLTLKEATAEITRVLKTERGKQEAAKIADGDREKALSGIDFAKLAQASGATLQVTRLFANGEILTEIGQNAEFYKSAFALGAKEFSPVILGSSAYYLLRLKERKEPMVPPLQSVRTVIERNLKESKGYELLRQKANQLLDQLKKEKDITKLAQQNGLKVEETGWFSRGATQLPKIGELAEAKAGGIALSAQKPIPDRIYTQKDSAYILAFKESQEADMERFEKEKESLAKQALAENRQRILLKFVEGLKAKGKIEIHAPSIEES
jgi:peptidyl-prolyl cis-trans isomerase D